MEREATQILLRFLVVVLRVLLGWMDSCEAWPSSRPLQPPSFNSRHHLQLPSSTSLRRLEPRSRGSQPWRPLVSSGSGPTPVLGPDLCLISGVLLPHGSLLILHSHCEWVPHNYGPTIPGLVRFPQEEETPHFILSLSPLALTHKRSCEDTVRWWLLLAMKWELNMPVLWSWTYQPPELWEIDACPLNHPVYGVLSQQPGPTQM